MTRTITHITNFYFLISFYEKSPLWILVGLVAIIAIVEITGFRFNKNSHEMVEQEYDQDYALREHCKQMPEMQGCEKFKKAPAMGGMNHWYDGSWCYGDLRRSVICRQYDSSSPGSRRYSSSRRRKRGDCTELRKLAQAIITAQEKEIAMMQKWSKDWNYSLFRAIRIWWEMEQDSQEKLSIHGSSRAW
jgi:hypothetical protein